MDTLYLGTILIWPINFAPRFFAYCHGQLATIADNAALFSLLGTRYGGDGRVTFGIPNFQGRIPIGAGQSPGTSNYILGQMGGSELAQLGISNMPTHSHLASTSTMTVALYASSNEATETTATTGAQIATVLDAEDSGLRTFYTGEDSPEVPIDMGAHVAGQVTIGNTGSGNPFYIVQPYIGQNFIICINGLFPSRN